MTEIYVEVLPGEANGDLGPDFGLPQRLADRVDDIGDALTEVAGRLRGRLAEQFTRANNEPWGLDHIELKFRFDLKGEGGVLIARTSVGAGFEASLCWRAPSAITSSDSSPEP